MESLVDDKEFKKDEYTIDFIPIVNPEGYLITTSMQDLYLGKNTTEEEKIAKAKVYWASYREDATIPAKVKKGELPESSLREKKKYQALFDDVNLDEYLRDYPEIKENVFPKEAMAYGKIKDINLFEQVLYKFINKKKWITFLKPKKIHLIIPGNYENVDKEILLTVLNNLGLTHITCYDEKTLYTINKNQIYINVHNSYLLLTKKVSKNIKTISYPFYILNGFENTINYILKH